MYTNRFGVFRISFRQIKTAFKQYFFLIEGQTRWLRVNVCVVQRLSSGKSACHENCPWGPVWAPKSIKSSPKASTSWKFCCTCRSLRSSLTFCFSFRLFFLKATQMNKITRKWKSFLPNIVIATLTQHWARVTRVVCFIEIKTATESISRRN